MTGIKEEALAFLAAVIAGVIVRLFYRCLSCFRGIVKHNLLAVGVEDFVFWLSSAVFLFVQIYHTSNGRLRWFVVLGIVVGALISSFLILKIEKMLKKIYDFNASKNIAKK